MPDPDALRPAVARVELPSRPEWPAQRPADRPEGRLVCLDRPLGFRQDPSNVMLHPPQDADIDDKPPLAHWSV